MKQNWKTFFKDKKITMMGLGLLGRGINVAKFLLEHGAILTITDLKPKERLVSSIEELKPFEKNITYVLGEHRMDDFKDRDLVIKAAGVPLDNPYIEEAKRNGIPVEMDASLFVKLAPEGVTTIGITGTRGKSTTTHLIYHILNKAGKKVFLGGNVRGLATLPLLEQVMPGDYVVLELDSWQLQGFGDNRISPDVAVFTNLMMDHMNYYKNDMDLYFRDKANIFLYQKASDTLVASSEIAGKIKDRFGKEMVGKIVEVDAKDFPNNWKMPLLGEHNLTNGALAISACKSLGIDVEEIRKGVESFEAVEGRLQYMGEKNGVKIYNDNNATTPEATAAGLRSVANGKNVILIMGGADKGLPYESLLDAIKKYCKKALLLSGTGTEKIKPEIYAIEDINPEENEKLEELVKRAEEIAKSGDVILFSPGFASFSKYFENEYQRNDLFVKMVNDWLGQ